MKLLWQWYNMSLSNPEAHRRTRFAYGFVYPEGFSCTCGEGNEAVYEAIVNVSGHLPFTPYWKHTLTEHEYIRPVSTS